MDQNERQNSICPGGGENCHDQNQATFALRSTPATPDLAVQTGTWRRVAAIADVPARGMRAFVVDGVNVLIAHTGDRFVAVQSLCPHEAIPLESGLIDGATLTCLEHMWQFDLETGAPLGEALEGLHTYPLKTEEDQLYIVL
jgi:nitrite reductase/ring-hydroxylating ferredoxin subunit